MTNDAQPVAGATSGSDGPGSELLDFGHAGERALRMIRQATVGGNGGELSPIEAVMFLDDALTQVRGLHTAVPALLAAARPGPAVEADIQARASELAALADQVHAARSDLERAEAGEETRRSRLAELATLREQVGELRRRERLAQALQELNEQRQVIEERVALLRQLTEQPENALAAGAGELVRLAGERQALLAPAVRDTLTQAEEAVQMLAREEERVRAEQQRLDTTQQRLAEAERRRAELQATREGQLAQLAAHARAESALADALSRNGAAATAVGDPVEQLNAVLDGVATQLDEVDGILRERLVSDQAGYDREHAIRGWSDREAVS
jgi:chromosome segregation ATPase